MIGQEEGRGTHMLRACSVPGPEQGVTGLSSLVDHRRSLSPSVGTCASGAAVCLGIGW